jgi:membrane protease YdiL (CAAX protease family)
MDEREQRNTGTAPDVFTAVNNYFLLFFCASCVLSSMYIQQLFFLLGQYRLGIGVSSVLGILLPIYLLMRKFPAGVRQQVRIARPQVHRMVLVVVLTLAAVVLIDQIYVINQRITPVPEDYADTIRELKPTNVLDFAITFMGLCVLVPVAEEAVFRGLIQQVFTRNMGPLIGVTFAGAIFGAVHLNAHLLISITAFGLFLGFLFNATGNLTYTIVAHSIFNGVALAELTIFPDVGNGDLPVYLKDVWVVVVALVLFVFLVAKIREGGSETEPPDQIPAE